MASAAQNFIKFFFEIIIQPTDGRKKEIEEQIWIDMKKKLEGKKVTRREEGSSRLRNNKKHFIIRHETSLEIEMTLPELIPNKWQIAVRKKRA